MKHKLLLLFTVLIISFVANAQAPVISYFNSSVAVRGGKVIIRGHYFTNVTGINFGSTSVNKYTVLNDSVITAVVGSGSSGIITVTTVNGTGTKSGFIHSLLM